MQIQSRLAVIAPYTKSIYGSPTDSQELSSLIGLAQSGYVDLAIVGTEALFRGNISAQSLAGYINQVKAAAPGVPVTTADTYDAAAYINGWYQLMSQAAGRSRF